MASPASTFSISNPSTSSSSSQTQQNPTTKPSSWPSKASNYRRTFGESREQRRAWAGRRHYRCVGWDHERSVFANSHHCRPHQGTSNEHFYGWDEYECGCDGVDDDRVSEEA
ncbi:hypothetical protein Syun_010331 [Stephania yunnanensis]|uniref:Uncharacterized protein n=1 Tax=Stephania yunnanensis TaxID=152371 RepID=A0AAP0KGB0_9MAGN